MTKNIQVSLIQMSMSEDMNENLGKAINKIKLAAAQGAEVVCLPELFRSPYFCTTEKNDFTFLEKDLKSLISELSKVSKECKVGLIAGSIYEQNDQGNFNTSLVFDSEGSHVGTYRKTHIPHDPSFYEQNFFKESLEGYKVFSVKVREKTVKIAVLICYDQWFPEAARSVALLGADIIFYPTAIGTVDGVDQVEGYWHEAWKTVQRGHAIANGTAVCGVNRVGREGSSLFWGGSFICNAFGHILAEGTFSESIVSANIDFSLNQKVKEGWRFFKERRPDTYSEIVKK